MENLVKNLMAQGVLQTRGLIEAFLANDRRRFVPLELAAEAYADAPLPIGEGQTISQPYTVAFMLELLQPAAGQKVLDIGFGSGWTTAILAHVVGNAGRVYGLEIVPALFEFGKHNLAKATYKNIELASRSGWEGWPEVSPFDRILAGAAASEIPSALKKQLEVGGRLVIPVGPGFNCSIKRIKKISAQKFVEEDYPGFAFVPFVK